MPVHVYLETINFLGSFTNIIGLFGYVITYIRKCSKKLKTADCKHAATQLWIVLDQGPNFSGYGTKLIQQIKGMMGQKF